MEDRYKVYAALYDESSEGWIWLPQKLEKQNFSSRDIIVIKTKQNTQKVYCICRIIDNNFKRKYNKSDSGRCKIDNTDQAIVMSSYYRDMLGGLKTQEEYEFEIKRTKCPYYKIRALFQHPDNAIRIAIWLAIISIMIGMVSIIISISSCLLHKIIVVGVAIIIGLTLALCLS